MVFPVGIGIGIGIGIDWWMSWTGILDSGTAKPTFC